MSPEVQNRVISDPTNGHVSNKNFKKKKTFPLLKNAFTFSPVFESEWEPWYIIQLHDDMAYQLEKVVLFGLGEHERQL